MRYSTANKNTTGELKPSQHLGLARLASQQYDRVERLPVPEDANKLYFRRQMAGNGQQQHFGTMSFEEWLHEQEIGVGSGTEASTQRGGRDRRDKTAVAAPAGLVVAYWSYDFREHAMGHLTRGLFCSHQAREIHYSVYKG